MDSPIAVDSSELRTYLLAAIPAGYNSLISGAPGIGKSDIVDQVCTELDADLILSHPAVEDPTTPGGLPWFEKGAKHATFKPFGNAARALGATKRTVWALEDFGQATPATQAAYMQYLLAGELNGHKLPSCVTMLALTNRRIDRAGVAGLLEPVKSRFVSLLELKAAIDPWCKWAYGKGINPTLIAFLRYRPELLSKFEPTADLTNSPSPRTWANLSKVEALKLAAALEAKIMAGSVGEAAAGEYLAFRRMVGSLVSVDAILLNPDTVRLPTAPDQLYATTVALAGRANVQNLGRIGTYAERLVKATRGEFAALLFRDAVRRDEALQYTDAFVRIASGPVGELISGRIN